MTKRFACAVYLGLLMAPAMAQTEVPASAPLQEQQAPAAAVVAEAEPAQVIVSGRRPGPGVWKVSKGEHVMWVFGLYSPLPQKMEWRSERAERLIAQSQEILLPPSSRVSPGFFSVVKALPHLIGIKKSPDGAKLRDVLPADVYARWLTLKDKYIGQDDDIEAYRPFFAAEELMDAGLKKAGLSNRNEVLKAIEAVAKKNKVKLSQTGYKVELDDPARLLKDFKKSQMDDAACFSKTIERLEGDIDAMRVRANAWAKGDIAELHALDFSERDKACRTALQGSTFAQNAPDTLKSMPERLREAWLNSAEKALAENSSTFALLKMDDILSGRGLLAALQAKGYAVESPQ